MSENNEKGFTLIELLVTSAIISVLATIAIPQYTQYKIRAYDAGAQINLHDVYLACKGYWTLYTSEDPCLVATVANNEHGFAPMSVIKIKINETLSNTEYDFFATGSHVDSPNIFYVNSRGVTGGDGDHSDGGDFHSHDDHEDEDDDDDDDHEEDHDDDHDHDHKDDDDPDHDDDD